jgi:hypothetical protein
MRNTQGTQQKLNSKKKQEDNLHEKDIDSLVDKRYEEMRQY